MISSHAVMFGMLFNTVARPEIDIWWENKFVVVIVRGIQLQAAAHRSVLWSDISLISRPELRMGYLRAAIGRTNGESSG
jgi:hypothetical protein